jgi:hypothetical protein
MVGTFFGIGKAIFEGKSKLKYGALFGFGSIGTALFYNGKNNYVYGSHQ